MKRALAILAGVAVALALAALAVFVARPLRTLEVLGRSTLRASGFRKSTLAAPKGPLTFFAAGSGPALVLLHGVNDQAGAWARVAKPLAAGRRVVIPDLPGHGESAPREGPLTVADVLAGVDALVAAESAAGPVDLVGNSMGGWIALLVARDRPDAVRRVVLVNGAAIRGPDRGVRLLPRTREEAKASIDATFGPRGRDVPGF
ncbi:MAG TPA: alpha/beta fold hydrolase, partial [Vicinamibacteria bacterium]|nr:alpha/beta fold hydrolase [Vicinamibacteria bacterium]